MEEAPGQRAQEQTETRVGQGRWAWGIEALLQGLLDSWENKLKWQLYLWVISAIHDLAVHTYLVAGGRPYVLLTTTKTECIVSLESKLVILISDDCSLLRGIEALFVATSLGSQTQMATYLGP